MIIEIIIQGTTTGHRKTKKSIGKYYRQQFEDILVNFDQLQMDEQPCGSGMHIFSSTDTMFIISSTYHYTGEFGVVYHAILTTKDGPTQEVAIKSTKSTVIK